MAILNIEGISKFYRRKKNTVTAVDDVSLSLGTGEFISIQGPSGCGKTTLLLSAGGLLSPDRGRVFMGDRDLYSLASEERAQLRAESIGFIFQQFHLIPFLTVLENVLAPSMAVNKGRVPVDAGMILEQFNLADRADHFPAELSTGERQRTALARALANNPVILLADEPTGNLDEENGRAVLQHLKDFASNGGAVLMVTHDIRVADYTEKVIRMEKGRIS